MPDIAMCATTSCAVANVCYRYRATPCQRQFWADWPAEAKAKLPIHCEGFISLRYASTQLSPENPELPPAAAFPTLQMGPK